MLCQGSTTADMSCPQRWQADTEPVWFDEFVLLCCVRVPQLLTCLVRNDGKLILNLCGLMSLCCYVVSGSHNC